MERNQTIDDVLVKQMKTNKHMLIQDLIKNAVATITTFKPKQIQLMTRIQHLIEQDYFYRAEDNRSRLIYIP